MKGFSMSARIPLIGLLLVLILGGPPADAKTPMAFTGYHLGAGFAVSTNSDWQIFNKGYSPSRNLFVNAQLGKDSNPGTASLPLRTISAAQALVRNIHASNGRPIQVSLRGTFYLQQTLKFNAADSRRGSK